MEKDTWCVLPDAVNRSGESADHGKAAMSNSGSAIGVALCPGHFVCVAYVHALGLYLFYILAPEVGAYKCRGFREGGPKDNWIA